MSPDPNGSQKIAERRALSPTPRQMDGESTDDRERGFEPVGPPDRRPVRDRWAAFADRVDLRRISGPRVPIFVFLALALFGRLDDLIFVVIAPELLVDFASGVQVLAFIAGITQVLTLLMMPVYGWLVDRIKRVHLIRIAHVGGNLASSAAAFAAGPLGFVGLRGTAGLLGVGDETPQSALLADYYEGESLGRLLSLIHATRSLALVIAPALGGILVSATNWRVALFVLGGMAVVVGLSTFLLREPKRGEAERRELGLREESAPPVKPPTLAEGWRAAGSIRTLRKIWYATPFQVAGNAGFYAFVPLYFSEAFGISAAQRGLIATMSAGTGMLALLWLGPVAARFLEHNPGRIMTMIAGLMALQAIPFAVMGASRLLPLSIVATLPVALGVTVILPLQQMVTLKIVPPRMRGIGISTVAPWGVLGLAIIYLSAAGGTRPVMFTLVAVQLIGAGLFASGAGTVERDLRAARSSVLAEKTVQESRSKGRERLLVCRGVEASYGGTQVLFGVDLDVEVGEMVALLGTNGAGKSTLLRAIAGVHHASSGAVLLDGQDITHEPAHANAGRGVVMMPGGAATFPALTVEQNLRAAAWMYRDDDFYVKTRLEEVMTFFPVLRERLGDQAGNLSGGEQQMVGLGQAFLMRPRLLMIDELSLGLAPLVVEQLLKMLRAINERGTTMMIVEQSVTVALTLAKRALFMEKGEIRFDGATEELLGRNDLLRSVFIGGATSAHALASPSSRRVSHRSDEEARTLEVREVSVRFGGLEALNQVSLEVAPGEVVGVIGPNGAGKTTLFDVISGFVPPDAGSVEFDGRVVNGLSPDARARLGLGRSFQSARLFPALTVRENIAVALERRTIKSEVMAALWLPNVRAAEAKVFNRADGLIEILGLEAFADKFADELSTGSRRAVEVACLMAAEPRLLLLDEPSSGLAQAETHELGPVLLRLVRDMGCSLLVIEHDMTLVSAISDRLVAMELGRVISDGSPTEVLADSRVLESYLGRDRPSSGEEALESIAPAVYGQNR